LEAADAAVDAEEEEEEEEAVADTLLLPSVGAAAARLGDDREGKWEEACEAAAVVAIASRRVHSRQTAAHSLTLLPPPSCPAACRSCLPGSVCVGGHEPRQSIDRPCGCVEEGVRSTRRRFRPPSKVGERAGLSIESTGSKAGGPLTSDA